MPREPEVDAVKIRDRLKRLRRQMARHHVDAYLVPSADPHQSEHVADCWKRREWISGFTGSAGDVVVTRRQAALWTDGRYRLQAAQQLEGTSIQLLTSGQSNVPLLPEWLVQTLKRGQVLGVDPRVVSHATAKRLQTALNRGGIKIKAVAPNLVDAIWLDQPSLPQGPVELHPQRFSGESAARKLRRLREILRRTKVDAQVITALDAIAWLFNIRGRDVPYNPVAMAYAIVTRRRALLFCDAHKMSDGVRRALQRVADIYPYAAFDGALAALGQHPRIKTVWADARTVSLHVVQRLRACQVVVRQSPIVRMKARKNRVEVAGACAAHQRDGVAMVRFLRWLHENVGSGALTELAASAEVRAYRAGGEHYRGESFAAISGYGPHGAIVHYAPTSATDSRLRPKGLYLIDSGGQYLDGTTDITRTVLLGGRATRDQRECFTRVLKGHIALARCRFPAGTTGRQLDVLARQHLWRVGLDYAHGTGHGVGSYLGVHEGPQSISLRDPGVPLEPGNVLSNEPGYYLEGKYGIRIENLMLVVPDAQLSARAGHPFLRFETLTLCPIDTRLVEPRLLEHEELAWLNAYHAHLREVLVPLLSPAARTWLAKATQPLKR